MIVVYYLDIEHASLRSVPARDIPIVGNPEGVLVAWNAGAYQKVATIDSDELSYAYQHTNNIDDSWSMDDYCQPRGHRGVTVEAPLHVRDGQTYGLRSSMVGDVFIKNGTAFVCSMVGWKEVEGIH
jgi:hypothetical protein